MEPTGCLHDSYKMGYKKQEWFELKRTGIMFELTVRDQDWKRLETIKINPHDFKKTMKDVGNRYGIEDRMLMPHKEIQDEINEMKKSNLFLR